MITELKSNVLDRPAASGQLDSEVQKLIDRAAQRPIALVLDDYLKSELDLEAIPRIEGYLKRGFPENHAIITAERQLMQEVNGAAFGVVIAFIQRLAAGDVMPRLIDRDAAHEVAAAHGVSNSSMGEWRRRRITQLLLAEDGATSQELADALHTEVAPIETILTQMVMNGNARKEGDRFRLCSDQ